MTDKRDLTPSSIKDPPTVSYSTGSDSHLRGLLAVVGGCGGLDAKIASRARRGVKPY